MRQGFKTCQVFLLRDLQNNVVVFCERKLNKESTVQVSDTRMPNRITEPCQQNAQLKFRAKKNPERQLRIYIFKKYC